MVFRGKSANYCLPAPRRLDALTLVQEEDEMQPQALLGTALIAGAVGAFIAGLSLSVSLSGVAMGLVAHALRPRPTIQR